MDNNEIISNEGDISETFNYFFINAVKSHDIVANTDLLSNTDGITDDIEIILKKYQFHPSILEIKKISIEKKNSRLNRQICLKLKMS